MRNWLGGTSGATAEKIFACPKTNIRLAYTSTSQPFTALHREALGSVRMVTNAAGAMVEWSVCCRFGQGVPLPTRVDAALGVTAGGGWVILAQIGGAA